MAHLVEAAKLEAPKVSAHFPTPRLGVGMSRIRVNIDRLILNGFEQLEGKALAEALQSRCREMVSVMLRPRADWARSHRTPVVEAWQACRWKQAPLVHEQLGRQVARAVARGLQ